MRKYFSVLLLLLSVLWQSAISQAVYQDVYNRSIYNFLDEMANEKLIELNSAVKPYTRMFIAKKLEKISDQSDRLNRRQQAELKFYLKDYNKELKPDKNFDKRFDIFYYKDSLFTFSLNAILGVESWVNENGSTYHRWNGAQVFAYVGPHLGVYASLRDNHDGMRLSDTSYLNMRPAAVYKNTGDYSEMRGGITWNWKWGTIGLVKDHMEWGNNYLYPSIISSKAPSFAQIKLNLRPVKWLEFNYFHGWLVSGIVDSSRSYYYNNSYGNSYREVFRNKFMAANMYTFKPFKGFDASIGNSIIYSDMQIHPAYLIPFFLYKSVDHTLINVGGQNVNSIKGKNNIDSINMVLGQNSQFFIDLSSRQIRHLHLYTTLFFDDVAITRWKQNGHLDYYSLNGGFQLSDLIPNTFFTVEYFQSYPLVYKHYVPTTTYESNKYNLGYYLQDNSRAVYAEFRLKPVKNLDLKLYYDFAEHGTDYDSLGTNRKEVAKLFLKNITWKSRSYGLSINYQIINDIFVWMELKHENTTGYVEKYTAKLFRGETNTLHFGVNYGF